MKGDIGGEDEYGIWQGGREEMNRAGRKKDRMSHCR